MKICRCADNKPVAPKKQEAKSITVQPPRPKPWEKTYVLLPSFEKVKGDKVLYAHARAFCTTKPTRLRPGA
ncbi:radical SAM domain-containing protein [Klebsiella pneumoniae]|uniref:Radical SAM domain-containing protein n=1 Tax=Klebsiella pneumoniae TaxID=573 RepID=A0A447RRG8_KLEPN|nr:radical SAM domain-containing protein [Klebsiella pneumoniae]